MTALRQARELTQLDAAEAIGISGKQLRRVELGQANVTLATLLACALFYKVDLRVLFAEDDVSETKHRARTLAQEQTRLSERVRGLRSQRGLTQEAAAERVGLSVIQYGRLERARANISLATLVAVAAAFRVKLGELFDG
jgi:transcriptional regulator with XRE-family HTH domain